MSADLAPVDRLAQHEATIARGLETFVEVGEALAAIRDERLYRETHGTFEAYCSERWNLSRSRAYRLIEAAEVVSPIGDTGLPMPTNEAQARELARVPEPQRAEVWRETLDRTAGKPTAAAVREVAQPPRLAPAVEPEPFDVDAAVERYPDLDAWRDEPGRVEALTNALDGYGETERAARLDALAKTAAARREGRLPGPTPPPDDRADRLFDHVNAALRVAQTVSPDEFAELTDPQLRETWRQQFVRATSVLSLYADVLSPAPTLRSVR